jgi:hypothetical protein
MNNLGYPAFRNAGCREAAIDPELVAAENAKGQATH